MSEADWKYFVFGLHLQANLPIPGLQPSKSLPAVPDVKIHFGLTPPTATNPSDADLLTYTSVNLSANGQPALRIFQLADGQTRRMDYADGSRFWLDPSGENVWASWPETLSLEDAATYLLGPVLGLLLRLRGVTCLHASAVAFSGGAVAFAGSEGAGKSTTAAALAACGHPVIADDVVAITERDRGFYVSPAYPYLSLWPDSVALLYGDDKALPRFSPNWDKRQLALDQNRLQFEEEALPLTRVFLLGERSEEPSAPFLEALSPKEAFVSLVTNSYATNVLDADMRAREFELIGRMVATVPVIRLRAHVDGSRIDRLCELIQRTHAAGQ